ncbi:AMP-binding protein [Paraglaciecola aquimarina]|uniref:AMP-binding protein n=1 Tax=Paraglaciecola algarum TaxID=3050085 RepID=A0ABS9D940_9ALTE|nr:AMP-binding protein [Paraglaciecola sp. G1-23]MCF2949315.1 AMP-binding protein [Paraglaciecola sp. G1-23]
MSLKTPLEMLYHWEETSPDSLYLRQPVDGRVDGYTWGQVAQQARKVAAYLISLDLPEGSHIAILSKNCAQWFITDLAIMLAGHISVPIYSTAGVKTVSYVLEHAKCPVIFVGKLDKTEEQMSAIGQDVLSLAFPYPNIPANKQWDEVLDVEPFTGKPIPSLDSIMTIIYTSGSTGNPKGVVHNYRSVSWSAFNCLDSLTITKDDRILSYLPLAHITERVLVEMSSFYSGMGISFIESLDTFSRDIVNTKPTLFISVPRLWTRFQMGVLATLPQKKLNFLLSIPFIGGLISKKIRTKLGLDKVRLCASGSAPISDATIHWFTKIGVNISEGWGMTENCAYGTCCVPFRLDKVGSIGKAYKGVDIRIAEDGEIQVKGPCNMKEYYLEPEKTAEVFTEDGYLRTGDKGTIDSEGYIKITGRLKEIFKTAKGKYVAPAPIEAKLMANSSIEQVCVTGAQLKQPIALIVLSEDASKQAEQDIEQNLLQTLEQVNSTLESHSKLDRLVIMQDEWTVDNGLLTPTLKVKRHTLEEQYDEFINGDLDGKIARQ